MTSPIRRGALMLACALAIAGCSVEGAESGAGTRVGPTPSTSTPVSTTPGLTATDAELAALARGAGLEPCPPGVEQPDAAVPGLPSGDLPCLDGNGVADLSAIRGLPMLVNVWASWCAPCIAEMPVLREAARDYAGTMRVLGININDDPERAIALLEDLGVTFPSVIDREATTRSMLAYPGPPVTYFVEADGTIAGRHDGALPDRATLDALVDRYLGIA